jgi:hypothetical protein
MAQVLPTLERLNEVFSYREGVLYWKAKPSPMAFRIKIGDIADNLKTNGYKSVFLDGKAYPSHRVIYKLFNDDFDGFIDHIDNNPSNNKIENLRIATPEQNQRNAKLRKDNTSGVKGVSWDKSKQSWRVRLQVNKKQKIFGDFKDLELAELVALEARDKYHGNFANHGI